MNTERNTHSKLMGYLLWIFGFTGAHRFYFGKPITGTLWFFTFGPARDRVAGRFISDPVDGSARGFEVRAGAAGLFAHVAAPGVPRIFWSAPVVFA